MAVHKVALVATSVRLVARQDREKTPLALRAVHIPTPEQSVEAEPLGGKRSNRRSLFQISDRAEGVGKLARSSCHAPFRLNLSTRLSTHV